jgi:hypothetical protein
MSSLYIIIRQAPMSCDNGEDWPAMFAVWERPHNGRGGVKVSQHATEDAALEAKARYEIGDMRQHRNGQKVGIAK